MNDAAIFHAWLASGDPILVAHARHRLEGRAIESPPRDGRPGVAESADLTRRMNACRYRSTDASCGCNGGKCGLRRGANVSHIDCFDCLRAYPD